MIPSDLHSLIAVSSAAADTKKHFEAEHLAQQLDLPFAHLHTQDFAYLLVLTPERLELRQVGSNMKPICVDFLSPSFQYRRLKGGGKNQLIARAVGIKGPYKPRILDATAGLGEDGFVLACLGCAVHWLERSPIIGSLLEDGLNRLKKVIEFQNIPLSLEVTDAKKYLSRNDLDFSPDVIYLDPMFPDRNGTALVKKEMRVLHDLLGGEENVSALLEAALRHPVRVVLKRPRLAPTVNIQRKPDVTFTGRSVRFDVYLPTNA